MNERIATVISYAGGLYSVVSSLTLTEWGIVTGIATAGATFVFNVLWQWRRDRREELAHQLKMKRYESDRRQGDVPVAVERRSDCMREEDVQ